MAGLCGSVVEPVLCNDQAKPEWLRQISRGVLSLALCRLAPESASCRPGSPNLVARVGVFLLRPGRPGAGHFTGKAAVACGVVFRALRRAAAVQPARRPR